MAVVRNIVKTFRIETSAGERKCHVSKDHIIKPGEQHFAYEETPGHRLNVCMQCAPAILEKAKKHIEDIIEEIKK
ncbi:hypothetical protein ACU6RQ_12475 [Zobellella denitrificans]